MLKGVDACDDATARVVTVNSDGSFVGRSMPLERRQVVSNDVTAASVDCAAAPGTCDVEVTGSLGAPSGSPARAPLTFDPKAPFVVASAHAAPATALRDMQFVTVTGTGFTPGAAVNLQECALPLTPLADCDGTNVDSVSAGYLGHFTSTFAVRRMLPGGFTTSGELETIDCAAKARRCGLSVQGTASQAPASVPLTFDPKDAAVTPAISASPNTGLHDNQQIAVTLRGFTPGQTVQVSECSAAAILQTPFGCDMTTSRTTTPAGPQPVSMSFRVHAGSGGQAGLTNCTKRPGACVLVAEEIGTSVLAGGITVTTSGGSSSPSVKLTFAAP